MFYHTMHYILLVLSTLVTFTTQDCSNEKNENKESLCCTHYYWDNGVCKECPPGYFGTNCSLQCIYPNYGQHCRNTCHCNVKDCNHVEGCQGNNTQTETSTIRLTKQTFSRNGYTHTSRFNEEYFIYGTMERMLTTQAKGASLAAFTGPWTLVVCVKQESSAIHSEEKSTLISDCSANLTQFISSSKMSLPVDKTNKENNNNKETSNGNLTIAILLVGCIVAILLVVNGIMWISKFVKRKFGNLENARDNYTLENVYLEINAGSEQQDSQANLTGGTVITEPCTSQCRVETRPELPARNTINEDQNPCHTHTNEDDETYINV